MTTIELHDLDIDKSLDREAMRAVNGGLLYRRTRADAVGPNSLVGKDRNNIIAILIGL